MKESIIYNNRSMTEREKEMQELIKKMDILRLKKECEEKEDVRKKKRVIGGENKRMRTDC